VETYTPKDLEKKYGSVSWISPYQRIVAVYDEETRQIEIHEYHARGRCYGGAAWETYHYPRVSPLVLSARREGPKNIFLVRTGSTTLNLVPGLAGAGIERASIDNKEINLTYAGLAGGGIAATICRGLAAGVKRIEVLERGGGNQLGRANLVLPLKHKLIVGIDDTDSPKGGATWSLSNEIAFNLENSGLSDYLGHTITQLYTKTPWKTTNCVSIALTLAAEPSLEQKSIEALKRELKEQTQSANTAMALYRGIEPAPAVKRYALEVKKRIVELREAEVVAQKNKVVLVHITGARGSIGALAAIGYASDPDEAVKIVK
jgi:methanogenesis imperfect marker protein 11